MKIFERYSITSFLTYVLIYTSIAGTIWHLSYWSTFNLNFFEFSDLSDLFKSVIYPYISNVWVFAVMIIWSASYFWGLSFMRENYTSQKSYEPSTTFRSIGVIMIIISAGLIFIFSGFVTNFGSASWFVLPICYTIILSYLFFQFAFLKKLIRDPYARLLSIFIFVFFPLSNYGVAKRESTQIKFMFHYKKVSEVVSDDTSIKDRLVNSAYLGSTNQYYFFYHFDKVIITNASNIKLFVLKDTFDVSHYERWSRY